MSNETILAGLSSLDSIYGGLEIKNTNMESILGLENIKFIHGDIIYEDNARLINPLEFNNVLEEVNSLQLLENDDMTNIDGIQIRSIKEDIIFDRNDELNSLKGLRHLESIGKDLIIDNNGNVLSLNSLNALREIGNNFILNNNFQIENLDSLANLTRIGRALTITDNTNLTSIAGIKNVDPNGLQILNIVENANLSLCSYDNICNYLSLPNNIYNLSGNLTGCNGPNELECANNRVFGRFFLDENENKLLDPNEIGLGRVPFRIDPLGFTYLTDENGYFNPIVPENETISIIPELDPEIWNLTTDAEQYTLTTTPDNLNNNIYVFGYKPKADIYQAHVQIVSQPTRCNEMVKFKVIATNEANLIENGILQVCIDLTSPVYTISPPEDEIDELNYKFSWNIENLQAQETFEAEIILNMPNETFIDSVLCYSAQLFDTSNGTAETLDSFVYKPIVLCSYDPNDKLVSPEGIEEEHLTLFSDSLFTYTIRFQNTGNALAKNVRILDTLDQALNLSTFKVVNSSFSPQVKIDGRAIEFVFEEIYLPDSLSNPEGSQGFVSFEILTNDNLPEQTRIENTAHIIFDFNPAIVTNTAFNTMVSSFGTVSTTDQFDSKIRIYPNPAQETLYLKNPSEFTDSEKKILDIYGNTVLQFSGDSVDLTTLPAGVYILILKNELGQISIKFVH